jgi:hypothetical protein
MLNFILKRMESIPTVTFTESELARISKPSFQVLKKQKCLNQVKYDIEKEPYYSSASGDNGNERFIRKKNGQYYAYSAEDPDIEPIVVNKAELSRYMFSLDSFFVRIRSANKIEGKIQRIKGGYFYIGHKIYDSCRVGFLFIPKIGEGKLVKFAGLKSLCKDDQILVVFTPATKIEDIELNWSLNNCKIVTASLSESLDTKTFKLPIEKMISGVLEAQTQLTELGKKKEKDYRAFEYKCYDKVHIPGKAPKYRSNEIEVNGQHIHFGDSLFNLFLRLVEELKKKKGGWVSRHTLGQEGIVTDSDKFQIYSNLRTALQGSLLKKSGQDFIECDGHKNYRISTHPDFVTYNKKKLLSHHGSGIQGIVKRLP